MKNIVLEIGKEWAVILVLGLFTAIILQSCGKTGKFEDTVWECNNLETVAIETIDPYTGSMVTLNYKAKVEISFNEEDADVVARISLVNPIPWFPDNTVGRGKAAYTYENGKMALEVEWNDPTIYLIDDGKWEGTADVKKSTMTLNNVFTQTATFTKR